MQQNWAPLAVCEIDLQTQFVSLNWLPKVNKPKYKKPLSALVLSNTTSWPQSFCTCSSSHKLDRNGLGDHKSSWRASLVLTSAYVGQLPGSGTPRCPSPSQSPPDSFLFSPQCPNCDYIETNFGLFLYSGSLILSKQKMEKYCCTIAVN